MHHCPECGQACYCHGDIDDCEVETPEYAAEHCECPFTREGCFSVFDDEDDRYDEDDEEVTETE